MVSDFATSKILFDSFTKPFQEFELLPDRLVADVWSATFFKTHKSPRDDIMPFSMIRVLRI